MFGSSEKHLTQAPFLSIDDWFTTPVISAGSPSASWSIARHAKATVS